MGSIQPRVYGVPGALSPCFRYLDHIATYSPICRSCPDAKLVKQRARLRVTFSVQANYVTILKRPQLPPS